MSSSDGRSPNVGICVVSFATARCFVVDVAAVETCCSVPAWVKNTRNKSRWMFGRISQFANERFCPARRTMRTYESQTKHICRMSPLGTTTIRNDPFETNQKQ
jgi:hypothetical protein